MIKQWAKEHMRSLLPTDIHCVYDPTCGDGLLDMFDDDVIRIGADVSKEVVDSMSGKYEVIEQRDVLKTYESQKMPYIISKPPFKMRWSHSGANYDVFEGWPSVPCETKADFAFVAHILDALTDNGIAVAMLRLGAMFDETETDIRPYLVERGCIESVTELKSAIDGSAIRTVVLKLRKQRKDKDVRFVEYKKYPTHAESSKCTASIQEIHENRYNLAPHTYISW